MVAFSHYEYPARAWPVSAGSRLVVEDAVASSMGPAEAECKAKKTGEPDQRSGSPITGVRKPQLGSAGRGAPTRTLKPYSAGARCQFRNRAKSENLPETRVQDV